MEDDIVKTHFGLPSCNYNISLSSEELQQLIETGRITVHANRIPCTTSRAVFDSEIRDFKFLDEKEVCNNLRFYLDEDVADLRGGDWPVQFLGIFVEKNCNSIGGKNGTEKDQNGSDGHYEL